MTLAGSTEMDRRALLSRTGADLVISGRGILEMKTTMSQTAIAVAGRVNSQPSDGLICCLRQHKPKVAKGKRTVRAFKVSLRLVVVLLITLLVCLLAGCSDGEDEVTPTSTTTGTPSPAQCKNEGEAIPLIPDPPECCEGLTLISPRSADVVGITGICTAKCGDGTCDPATETDYNCPQDCKEEAALTSTTSPTLEPTLTKAPQPQETPITCLPSGTEGSQRAPKVSPLIETRPLDGAALWLFAVNDGEEQVAVSAEASGKILIGRLDSNDSNAEVNWQVAASSQDTRGTHIADHWHIFAHEYHWIVFAANDAKDSFLLQLDKDFNRIRLVTVVRNSNTPTNDMFMVAEPDGVAVAHFLPGYGHIVYRLNLQGELVSTVNIGGSFGSVYNHSNGSSAIPLDGGYLVLATETLNPMATGRAVAIVYNQDWQAQCLITLFDEDRKNAAMPSGVRLDNGYLIVNLRVLPDVNPRGVPSQSQDFMMVDTGSLVRLVVALDGSVVSQETFVESGGNRPHTALVGDRLVTTWDSQAVGALTANIRVDTVTLP